MSDDMTRYGDRGDGKPRWNRNRIDRAFDALYHELGRGPTRKEFEEASRGAIRAISHGRYSPGIHSWPAYLTSRGLRAAKPKWTPEAVDAAFDALRKEGGRIPTAREFRQTAAEAIGQIFSGTYDPDIRTYRSYLDKRKGESPQKDNRPDGDDNDPEGPAGMLAPLGPRKPR